MKRKIPTYKDFEKQFPDYIILQKERFMYTAHGKSAEAFGYLLDYKVVQDEDGLAFTGGPDAIKISDVLKANDVNFLIIEDHKIVEGHSGRNPFENPMKF